MRTGVAPNCPPDTPDLKNYLLELDRVLAYNIVFTVEICNIRLCVFEMCRNQNLNQRRGVSNHANRVNGGQKRFVTGN